MAYSRELNPNYKAWLLQKRAENSSESAYSRTGRIQENYGNLEIHFQNKTYHNIINELTYSDEINISENSSIIDINGNLFNGLKSLRDAAELYLKFLIEQNISTYEEYQKLLAENIDISRKSAHEDRLSRLKNAPKRPKGRTVSTAIYIRNPDVVAEVLLRANGICEKCNNEAPFIRKSDNTPYLEVHHIDQLANGGDDTVENAQALCPNCHREAHFG